MDFFKKTKKLSKEQLKEIATLCGAVALLLVVGVFSSSPNLLTKGIALSTLAPQSSQTANILPCSWFGDCSYPAYVTMTLTPLTNNIAPGTPVTFQWVAASYGANNFRPACNGSTQGPGAVCELNAGAPSYGPGTCVPPSNECTGWSTFGKSGEACASWVQIPGSGDCGNLDEANGMTYFGPSGQTPGQYPGYEGGYYIVNPGPQTTTTYYSCSTFLTSTYGAGCAAATVTVTQPTINADATSNSPVTVGQSATISFYANGTPSNPDTCQINNFNDTVVLWKNTGSGCPSSKNSSYTTPAYTAPGTYGYKFYYSLSGVQKLVKTINVVVNSASGPDSCTDIPGTQSSVPNGCVTPAPIPGNCVPTGGSFSPSANSCSCPSGQHLSGTACVADTAPGSLCSNGLADSYAPSCTCPAGQVQSGSLCVTVDVCSNISGSQGSAPADGHTNGDGTCSCNSGFTLSGGSCVVSGVVSSFSATPSRVQRGRQTTLSWSTSNMLSCLVKDSSGNAISTALNSLGSSATVNAQTIYSLSCIDVNNTPYPTQSVTVTIVPTTIEQ